MGGWLYKHKNITNSVKDGAGAELDNNLMFGHRRTNVRTEGVEMFGFDGNLLLLSSMSLPPENTFCSLSKTYSIFS